MARGAEGPFDALLVLGGGVPPSPDEQLPFVANRCDAALAVRHAHEKAFRGGASNPPNGPAAKLPKVRRITAAAAAAAAVMKDYLLLPSCCSVRLAYPVLLLRLCCPHVLAFYRHALTTS